MKKATLKEFVNQLVPRLQVLAHDDYEVFTHDVIKANDTKFIAISIRKTGENIAKNIYVEPYYQQFMSGERNVDEIAKMLFEVAVDVEMQFVDCESIVNNLYDYEKLKSHIVVKLLNAESNKEYLQGKCYMPLYDTDMVIVFFILAVMQEDGIGTMAIPEKCFNAWEITKEELYQNALENMQKEFPAVVKPLFDMVKELAGDKDDSFFGMMNPPECNSEEHLYVVTNSTGVNGACSILYPKLLEELCKSENVEQLVILPSSIHETIVIPYVGDLKLGDLKHMVMEVNETSVANTETLSYEVFIYSAGDKVIRTWKAE